MKVDRKVYEKHFKRIAAWKCAFVHSIRRLYEPQNKIPRTVRVNDSFVDLLDSSLLGFTCSN